MMDIADNFLKDHITIEVYMKQLSKVFGGEWDKARLNRQENNWRNKQGVINVPKRIVTSREKQYYLKKEVDDFFRNGLVKATAPHKSKAEPISNKKACELAGSGYRHRRMERRTGLKG